MTSVTIQELQAQAEELVDRAAHGEQITVLDEGEAVAQLRALTPRPTATAPFFASCQTLSPINPVAFRSDLDRTLDAHL